MNTDTIQDIIRDAHALAQWPGEADLIRSGAGAIARRLEWLVSHGLYITPKAALDAVTANPPMSEGVKECGSEGVEKRGLVGIRYNDTSIIAPTLLVCARRAQPISAPDWRTDAIRGPHGPLTPPELLPKQVSR